MTRDEILRLLDMSEDDALWWLVGEGIVKIREAHPEEQQGHKYWPKESLADLAYRLRDEAIKKDREAWGATIEILYGAAPSPKPISIDVWWIDLARPIHAIIAALLVLQGEDE